MNHDPLGTDALAALVNELNIGKHEPKLQAASISTLRQLKALDDDGLSALGLPKGPTVRLREKLKSIVVHAPVVTPPAAAPQTRAAPSASRDNECPICCDRPSDRRANCKGKHEFCSVCIQQWRAQTVLKAQQGTFCPCCREPITEVTDLTTGSVAAPVSAAPWGGASAAPPVQRAQPKPLQQRATAPRPVVQTPRPLQPPVPFQPPQPRPIANPFNQPPASSRAAALAPARGPSESKEEGNTRWRSSGLDQRRQEAETHNLKQGLERMRVELETSKRDLDAARRDAQAAAQQAYSAKTAKENAEEGARLAARRATEAEARTRSAVQDAVQRASQESSRALADAAREKNRLANEVEALKDRLQAATTAASGYQRAQRDAEDARDRVQRELQALRSRQSQQLNAQWNQRQAQTHQTQQRQPQYQQPPPQRPPPQRPPPPPARAAAPPPSGDSAPTARCIPGATPAQWACPHCTFANLLHRTQTTAGGLSICELCTRTARVQ